MALEKAGKGVCLYLYEGRINVLYKSKILWTESVKNCIQPLEMNIHILDFTLASTWANTLTFMSPPQYQIRAEFDSRHKVEPEPFSGPLSKGTTYWPRRTTAENMNIKYIFLLTVSFLGDFSLASVRLWMSLLEGLDLKRLEMCRCKADIKQKSQQP